MKIFNIQCYSDRFVCIIEWPDGPQGGSAYDLGYNLVFFALSYIFPMIMMTYSYVRIYIALNKKLNVAVQSSALLKSIKMKQKVRVNVSCYNLLIICQFLSSGGENDPSYNSPLHAFLAALQSLLFLHIFQSFHS